MRRRDIREAVGAGTGPLAVILVEDRAALSRTIDHHEGLGFDRILVFTPDLAEVEETERVRALHWHRVESSAQEALNAVIAAVHGRWVYWGYNGEFLFFPFSATRKVPGLLAFHESERREAMFATVVDLYPGDATGIDRLTEAPSFFDREGYISERPPSPLDRELHLRGGLRRRFAEHVPEGRDRIDRIPLFRAKAGLTLDEDLLPSDPEMRTDACPWHRNVTAAVASYRAAKALLTNPSSREAAERFTWPGSEPFQWDDAQFMEHGLMEPGQWF